MVRMMRRLVQTGEVHEEKGERYKGGEVGLRTEKRARGGDRGPGGRTSVSLII